MALINFKGITQNSSLEKHITDEEFESITKEYYALPDFDLVKKQLKSLHQGKTKMNVIYDYYLKKVMSKAIGTRASWSIADGIHNRQIMEYFAAKVDKNKKVFPDKYTLAEKIEIAFRLCGIRYCVKLPNFPIKTVRNILDKYNVNNNYYDYSCGWASRMLGALSKNVNYYGTEPNYELVDRLNELCIDYKIENKDSVSNVDIRCHGSQKFVEEWENKIGLAFSSPPYYNLEDYQLGNQSYKQGMSYEEWRDSYIVPTVENISRYLIKDGYFIVNAKNFRDYKTDVHYPILDDFKNTAEKNGMNFIGTETLKNIKRCHGNEAWNGKENNIFFSDNDEKMYVFQKKMKKNE